VKKNKIKISDIEISFQYITDCINNKKYWKAEKKHLKALRLYKKNKIDKLYNSSKEDNKYKEILLVQLNDWCNQCLNTKKWENFKQVINHYSYHHKAVDELKNIKLTNKTYQLLNGVALQENISVSELISLMIEAKVDNLPHQNNDNEITKTFTEENNNIVDEEQLLTYEIVKKDNYDTIDLSPYAGGQCQALSQTTKKRCKKITPLLSIKNQQIGDIIYEFSVCQTHNKETSKLAPNYIKNC
jgi:hypothetical protein